MKGDIMGLIRLAAGAIGAASGAFNTTAGGHVRRHHHEERR